MPSEPRLSCGEECIEAINECLSEEGCPLQTSKKLDTKLSVDMVKASASAKEFRAYAERDPASPAEETAVRLEGFLQRASDLRTQLRASRQAPNRGTRRASAMFGGDGRGERQYPATSFTTF